MVRSRQPSTRLNNSAHRTALDRELCEALYNLLSPSPPPSYLDGMSPWAVTHKSSAGVSPIPKASGVRRKGHRLVPDTYYGAGRFECAVLSLVPNGVLNTCFNALDRHVRNGRGDQAALIYDSPVTGTQRTYTYAELLDEVARFAGVLRGLGVTKGNRVIIYMPMIPEAPIAMLALRADRRGALGGVRRLRGVRTRDADR